MYRNLEFSHKIGASADPLRVSPEQVMMHWNEDIRTNRGGKFHCFAWIEIASDAGQLPEVAPTIHRQYRDIDRMC